jgi:hypothetical protein
MRCRTAGEHVERLQDSIDAEGADLRRCRLVGGRSASTPKQADPDVPAGLHDRAADCRRPLLAIADAASGDWPEVLARREGARRRRRGGR